MKGIILPNVSDVCTGEFDFSINSVVEESTTKILQVLFELEHCDGKPIVVDTEALVLCGGTCDVVLDELGKAKVDMKTISFSATIAAEVE